MINKNQKKILEKTQERNGLKDFIEFIEHSWCIIKNCEGCLFDTDNKCILRELTIKNKK